MCSQGAEHRRRFLYLINFLRFLGFSVRWQDEYRSDSPANGRPRRKAERVSRWTPSLDLTLPVDRLVPSVAYWLLLNVVAV
jgi:hypothetical protein